jgi:hypothetical protein
VSREPASKINKASIFGARATTAEEAFIRFGNAVHWEAYYLTDDQLEEIKRSKEEFPSLLPNATLESLPRAEHCLVAEFIAQLTSGAYTFAEACAIWKRSENDTHYIGWRDPDDFLRFLALVRERIDPNFWPASQPRFKME